MVSDGAGDRRAFLAGATGAIAAASGCLGGMRNLAGRARVDQLSLRVSTLPASHDPYAVRIANRLVANLERAGIATTVDPMAPDVLLRETLFNHNFDLYVAGYPSQGDPDELRSMLYSAYGEETGWQNPFGFSDLETDELLDEQRRVPDSERPEVIGELQRRIVGHQPFTVVGFPDRIGAIRDGRFEAWPDGGLSDPIAYLRLGRVDGESTLRLSLRNGRITRNRNPIAAEHRDRGVLTGLLYEPLLRTGEESGDPVPWLARRVEWDREGSPAATVRLRETTWHDGKALTARDVAFTYGLLEDTSLDGFDTPIPTPWRRGRVSLAETVDVRSADELRIEFATENRTLARRALSVPILPAHVWRDRTGSADPVGGTTEALVTPNEAAIGSGPLRFETATADESLSLVAFPEHFLYAGDTDGIPDRLSEPPRFDRVEFDVVPSHDAAVELLVAGETDASADGLGASVVPRIVRADEVSLTIDRSEEIYHVGYNCRQSPMTDPRFRRAVARHLDRTAIADEVFGGYGTPAETPLHGRWVPAELEWDGEARLPFLGTEDELDVDRARAAFREAGYQYDGDRLVRRGQS